VIVVGENGNSHAFVVKAAECLQRWSQWDRTDTMYSNHTVNRRACQWRVFRVTGQRPRRHSAST